MRFLVVIIILVSLSFSCKKNENNGLVDLPQKDTTGPLITIINPDTNYSLISNFDFTIRAVLFDTSEVDSFGIDLQTNFDTNIIYNTNGRANAETYIVESKMWQRWRYRGSYQVRFYARDKLGNVSQAIKNFNLARIDSTPPEINYLTIGNPRGGLSYYNHTNQIQFNVWDRGSGTKKLVLTITNNKTQDIIHGDIFIQGSRFHPFPQHEAINYNLGSNPNPGEEVSATLTLTATDYWNNSNSKSLQVTIKDK